MENTDEPLVKLVGVTKNFGAFTAVHALDLSIEQGDFLAILGPSGCGKTTLLRMIGGFESVSSGSIEIAGQDVTKLTPERRPTNMVFQSYGLFPHMNVRQNVAYGLRLRKLPRQEIDKAADEMLELVHLTDYADRSILKLSGGQQQRVALARALIMRPAVLLLDEPLAALDLKLRKEMQEELRRLHRAVKGTFVFVTHDQGEALGLANRIAVMSEGRFVQMGGPRDIYLRPATRFVSTFIGDANVYQGKRIGGKVRLPWGAVLDSPGSDGVVSLSIRPENLGLDISGEPCGTVRDIVFMGPVVAVTVALPNGEKLLVNVPEGQLSNLPEIGQPVAVSWSPNSILTYEE